MGSVTTGTQVRLIRCDLQAGAHRTLWITVRPPCATVIQGRWAFIASGVVLNDLHEIVGVVLQHPKSVWNEAQRHGQCYAEGSKEIGAPANADGQRGSGG